MSNVIKQYEKEQIEKLTEKKEVPEFRAGDTVRVSVRVIDGTTERLQAYEGVVIAKRNKGLDKEGYRAEFIKLVEIAELMDKRDISDRD